DKHQTAEITPGIHPAIQDNRLTDLIDCQLTAGVRAFQEHGISIVSEEFAPRVDANAVILRQKIGKTPKNASTARFVTILPFVEKRQGVQDSDTTTITVVRPEVGARPGSKTPARVPATGPLAGIG